LRRRSKRTGRSGASRTTLGTKKAKRRATWRAYVSGELTPQLVPPPPPPPRATRGPDRRQRSNGARQQQNNGPRLQQNYGQRPPQKNGRPNNGPRPQQSPQRSQQSGGQRDPQNNGRPPQSGDRNRRDHRSPVAVTVGGPDAAGSSRRPRGKTSRSTSVSTFRSTRFLFRASPPLDNLEPRTNRRLRSARRNYTDGVRPQRHPVVARSNLRRTRRHIEDRCVQDTTRAVAANPLVHRQLEYDAVPVSA